MPITATRLARYTILGAWTNGHAVNTVLDYHVDDNFLALGSRDESIVALADDIMTNWQSQVMPPLCNNYSVSGIRYMDLNTAGGITGERPADPGEDNSGNDNTPAEGPAACYLVKKVTSSARGTKQGRIYVPGVAEGAVNEDGVISMGSDTVIALQAGLTQFLTNTTETGVTAEDSTWMVVAHFGPRPPVGEPDDREGTSSRVTSLIVDTVQATQRRRLR